MPRKRKNSDARQPVYLLIALICILVPAVIIGMLISLPAAPLRQPNSWELTATQVFSEQTAVAEMLSSTTPTPSPDTFYLTATQIIAEITATAEAAITQTAVCAGDSGTSTSGTPVFHLVAPAGEDDTSWKLSDAEIAAERCLTPTPDTWVLTATQIVAEITQTAVVRETATCAVVPEGARCFTPTITPTPNAQQLTATQQVLDRWATLEMQWPLTATQIVAEITQTAESEQTATQAAR